MVYRTTVSGTPSRVRSLATTLRASRYSSPRSRCAWRAMKVSIVATSCSCCAEALGVHHASASRTRTSEVLFGACRLIVRRLFSFALRAESAGLGVMPVDVFDIVFRLMRGRPAPPAVLKHPPRRVAEIERIHVVVGVFAGGDFDRHFVFAHQLVGEAHVVEVIHLDHDVVKAPF